VRTKGSSACSVYINYGGHYINVANRGNRKETEAIPPCRELFAIESVCRREWFLFEMSLRLDKTLIILKLFGEKASFPFGRHEMMNVIQLKINKANSLLTRRPYCATIYIPIQVGLYTVVVDRKG
jgi:hypothetical protein